MVVLDLQCGFRELCFVTEIHGVGATGFGPTVCAEAAVFDVTSCSAI